VKKGWGPKRKCLSGRGNKKKTNVRKTANGSPPGQKKNGNWRDLAQPPTKQTRWVRKTSRKLRSKSGTGTEASK